MVSPASPLSRSVTDTVATVTSVRGFSQTARTSVTRPITIMPAVSASSSFESRRAVVAARSTAAAATTRRDTNVRMVLLMGCFLLGLLRQRPWGECAVPGTRILSRPRAAVQEAGAPHFDGKRKGPRDEFPRASSVEWLEANLPDAAAVGRYAQVAAVRRDVQIADGDDG